MLSGVLYHRETVVCIWGNGKQAQEANFFFFDPHNDERIVNDALWYI